ncbi:hypothetical protein DIPPA_24368 [Diplonema papillatum]|nr:hypothetical protein DIPPA_24368 [Diplonema papillatum]
MSQTGPDGAACVLRSAVVASHCSAISTFLSGLPSPEQIDTEDEADENARFLEERIVAHALTAQQAPPPADSSDDTKQDAPTPALNGSLGDDEEEDRGPFADESTLDVSMSRDLTLAEICAQIPFVNGDALACLQSTSETFSSRAEVSTMSHTATPPRGSEAAMNYSNHLRIADTVKGLPFPVGTFTAAALHPPRQDPAATLSLSTLSADDGGGGEAVVPSPVPQGSAEWERAVRVVSALEGALEGKGVEADGPSYRLRLLRECARRKRAWAHTEPAALRVGLRLAALTRQLWLAGRRPPAAAAAAPNPTPAPRRPWGSGGGGGSGGRPRGLQSRAALRAPRHPHALLDVSGDGYFPPRAGGTPGSVRELYHAHVFRVFVLKAREEALAGAKLRAFCDRIGTAGNLSAALRAWKAAAAVCKASRALAAWRDTQRKRRFWRQWKRARAQAERDRANTSEARLFFVVALGRRALAGWRSAAAWRRALRLAGEAGRALKAKQSLLLWKLRYRGKVDEKKRLLSAASPEPRRVGATPATNRAFNPLSLQYSDPRYTWAFDQSPTPSPAHPAWLPTPQLFSREASAHVARLRRGASDASNAAQLLPATCVHRVIAHRVWKDLGYFGLETAVSRILRGANTRFPVDMVVQCESQGADSNDEGVTPQHRGRVDVAEADFFVGTTHRSPGRGGTVQTFRSGVSEGDGNSQSGMIYTVTMLGQIEEIVNSGKYSGRIERTTSSSYLARSVSPGQSPRTTPPTFNLKPAYGSIISLRSARETTTLRKPSLVKQLSFDSVPPRRGGQSPVQTDSPSVSSRSPLTPDSHSSRWAVLQSALSTADAAVHRVQRHRRATEPAALSPVPDPPPEACYADVKTPVALRDPFSDERRRGRRRGTAEGVAMPSELLTRELGTPGSGHSSFDEFEDLRSIESNDGGLAAGTRWTRDDSRLTGVRASSTVAGKKAMKRAAGEVKAEVLITRRCRRTEAEPLRISEASARAAALLPLEAMREKTADLASLHRKLRAWKCSRARRALLASAERYHSRGLLCKAWSILRQSAALTSRQRTALHRLEREAARRLLRAAFGAWREHQVGRKCQARLAARLERTAWLTWQARRLRLHAAWDKSRRRRFRSWLQFTVSRLFLRRVFLEASLRWSERLAPYTGAARIHVLGKCLRKWRRTARAAGDRNFGMLTSAIGFRKARDTAKAWDTWRRARAGRAAGLAAVLRGRCFFRWRLLTKRVCRTLPCSLRDCRAKQRAWDRWKLRLAAARPPPRPDVPDREEIVATAPSSDEVHDDTTAVPAGGIDAEDGPAAEHGSRPGRPPAIALEKPSQDGGCPTAGLSGVRATDDEVLKRRDSKQAPSIALEKRLSEDGGSSMGLSGTRVTDDDPCSVAVLKRSTGVGTADVDGVELDNAAHAVNKKRPRDAARSEKPSLRVQTSNTGAASVSSFTSLPHKLPRTRHDTPHGPYEDHVDELQPPKREIVEPRALAAPSPSPASTAHVNSPLNNSPRLGGDPFNLAARKESQRDSRFRLLYYERAVSSTADRRDRIVQEAEQWRTAAPDTPTRSGLLRRQLLDLAQQVNNTLREETRDCEELAAKTSALRASLV